MNVPLAGILQDRNDDGVIDYVNARIYVPDEPTPYEIAAAANIAARLCFETLSLDLPIAFPISSYDPSDSRRAIVVGKACGSVSANTVIPFPDVRDAEHFAKSVALEVYKPLS